MKGCSSPEGKEEDAPEMELCPGCLETILNRPSPRMFRLRSERFHNPFKTHLFFLEYNSNAFRMGQLPHSGAVGQLY